MNQGPPVETRSRSGHFLDFSLFLLSDAGNGVEIDSNQERVIKTGMSSSMSDFRMCSRMGGREKLENVMFKSEEITTESSGERIARIIFASSVEFLIKKNQTESL